MLMRRRWLSLVGALGVAACTLVLTGDLEVNWTLSGGSCSSYGIYQWMVTASGPEQFSRSYSCVDSASGQTTGPDFHLLDEGYYTITVSAVSSSGATLATQAKNISVMSTAGLPYTLAFGFTASDFTGGYVCGNGICEDTKGETATNCATDCTAGGTTIHAYWSINDTTDGTDTGTSWDTCSEVGAASIVINIDGADHTYPCTPQNTSISVAAGTHTLTAKLVDGSGTAITQTTGVASLTPTAGTPAVFSADFPWNSFNEPIKSSTTGDFLFKTTYAGGHTCSTASPQVDVQIAMLNGAPTGAKACDTVTSVCFATNGVAYTTCSDNAFRVAGLKWGSYTLLAQGAQTVGSGNPEVCWSSAKTAGNPGAIDIIVGAGTTNPTVVMDLEKVSSSGACQ